MTIDGLIKKYHAQVATVPKKEKWVRSIAGEVNVANEAEMSYVKDLSEIMDEFIDRYGCGGVSSNNIYWNKTDAPLRVIRVQDPSGDDYLTLINPVIRKMQGPPMTVVEECGSFPGMGLLVPRASYVQAEGILLEGEGVRKIKLDYGEKRKEPFNQREFIVPDISSRFWTAAAFQHECDHLDGITILDRSNLLDWLLDNEDFRSGELDPSLRQLMESMHPPVESYLVPGKNMRVQNGYAYDFSSAPPLQLALKLEQIA